LYGYKDTEKIWDTEVFLLMNRLYI